MDTRIKFLYLSEPDMIKAGVKNMDQCVEAMEDNIPYYLFDCYSCILFYTRKMQTTAGLWRCRHILEENTRWPE